MSKKILLYVVGMMAAASVGLVGCGGKKRAKSPSQPVLPNSTCDYFIQLDQLTLFDSFAMSKPGGEQEVQVIIESQNPKDIDSQKKALKLAEDEEAPPTMNEKVGIEWNEEQTIAEGLFGEYTRVPITPYEDSFVFDIRVVDPTGLIDAFLPITPVEKKFTEITWEVDTEKTIQENDQGYFFVSKQQEGPEDIIRVDYSLRAECRN